VLWFTFVPATSAAWVFGTGPGKSILPPGDYVSNFLPGLLLFGIGLMIMVAPLTTAVMTSVPEHNSGVASAINNAISRVGPQLAGALIFVAIASSFYTGLASRVPGLDPSNPDVRKAVAPLNRPKANVIVPVDGRTVRGAQIVDEAAESSTHAFHLSMVIGAALLLAGAIVNGVGIRNPPRPRLEDHGAAGGADAGPAPPDEPEHHEDEPAHEEVGVGVVADSAAHEELHESGAEHHHHMCVPHPMAGTALPEAPEGARPS